jgi:hypothetical protein
MNPEDIAQSWVPPAEVWSHDGQHLFQAPYYEDPYYPDPYA